MTPSRSNGWKVTLSAVNPANWPRTVRLLGDLFAGGIVVPAAGRRADGDDGERPEIWTVIQADGDIQTKILGDPAGPGIEHALKAHYREVAGTLQRLAGLGTAITGARALMAGIGTVALLGGTAMRWQADPHTDWMDKAWQAGGGWPLVAAAAGFLLGAFARNALMAWVGFRLRAIARNLAAEDSDQQPRGA